MKPRTSLIILHFLLFSLTACMMPAKLTYEPPNLETIYAKIRQTLTPNPSLSETILTPESTLPPDRKEKTLLPSVIEGQPKLYLHPGLPLSFLNHIELEDWAFSSDKENANVRILIGHKNDITSSPMQSTWTFVLAAPFYILHDEVSWEALSAAWQGKTPNGFDFEQIYVSPETRLSMNALLGEADDRMVKGLSEVDLNSFAFSRENGLVILPFEDLTPFWKVLRVEGQSPIENDFNPENYPLSIHIWVEGELGVLPLKLPARNYDPQKRTTLIMTGVTALTRATAYQMEINGYHFPGQDIQEWLSHADLTHISNEVSFTTSCPYPDPVQVDLIFCSDPEYIHLLAYVGADIIELSGNHLLDYGETAFEFTLETYDDQGWMTYAGGWDISDASKPAIINHNNNQLAFLGCNAAGPPNDWATETRPGTAPCGNYNWLVEEIQGLRSEGILPIVTLQYTEDYTPYPSPQMETDFQRLAEAGAVVVNGSQAHTPKTMTFHHDAFLHYGLGNLFFDQMEVYDEDALVPHTREEFLDRLVFYDGQLVSIELLTAILEDYARPRPMTEAERQAFLSRIFTIANE